MSQICAQHPDVPALYVCDGCQRALCSECIEESHVLFLCKICGERAMPLYAGQAASTKDLRKVRRLNAPYSIAEALAYPLRGSGLAMYIATLITLSFLGVLSWFGQWNPVSGCFAFLLTMAFWGMVVGLQFKIVRTTADGENELPDWPDFTDFLTLIQDLLVWIIIHAFMVGAVVWFLTRGLLQGGLSLEPRMDFWVGFALVLWLGTAFMVMAYGAVGNFRRLKVFELHNHVRGFVSAGADAVKVTNLIYVLAAIILPLKTALEFIPIVGSALSSIIFVYWIFVVPHLSGLVFRRHNDQMERLYWPAT